MFYTLAIHATVSLVIGLTLLWLWKKHDAQVFARDVGLAYLVQVALPVGYALMEMGEGPDVRSGKAILFVASIAFQTLMFCGAMRMAGRVPTAPQLVALAGALTVVNLYGFVTGDLQAVQGGYALIATGVAMLVCVWLWKHTLAERTVGVLLVGAGVIQGAYAVGGDDYVALQASVSTVLQLALGLALLIAALERTAGASRHARERFEGLVKRSPLGIVVRTEDRVLYCNPVLRDIYRFAADQAVTVAMLEATIPAGERAGALERGARLLKGEIAEMTHEGARIRPDGSEVWLRFLCWRTEWDGQPAVQVMVSDQTAQREATQALVHQALHDRLTGLPNRSALQQWLARACPEDALSEPFGLLMLDIDRFQLFNDAHGHALGDEVLKALGAALARDLRGVAEVMHLGEDEFALLCVHAADEHQVRAVASRVQRLLMRPLALSQHEFFIDVSMGVALYPLHARQGDLMLRAANAAMHAAKRIPGTSLALAEEGFERGSGDLLGQEQALRAGIQNREFFLCYQPKVDATTRELTGFEALARWDHPGRGRVSPVEFIAAAERTGLIGDLGLMLLQQACAQAAAWRLAHGHCVPIAVNVSPLQMLDSNFVGLLRGTLARYALPPEALSLEITESAAVVNLAQARAQIAELRELGVEVALDDFGTGFSSLNMLRNLPLHAVKIDRGLIDPLPASDAAAVVHAVCQLARALSIRVIAEGVESDEHAVAAGQAGCHELQGYWFAMPLNATQASLWLEAGGAPQPAAAVARHEPSIQAI